MLWHIICQMNSNERSQCMNAVNSYISHAVSLARVWELNRRHSYASCSPEMIQRFTRAVERCVFVSLFSLKLELLFTIIPLLPFPSKYKLTRAVRVVNS